MGRSASMTYLTQAEELMRAKRKEEAKPEGMRQPYLSRAEELLEAMSEEETNLETKKPRRISRPEILMACFCVLIIAELRAELPDTREAFEALKIKKGKVAAVRRNPR